MNDTRLQPRSGPVPPRLMLQYLVVLAGTTPLVWRRIRVPATYSFWDLHVAIQDAMGWEDRHLHQFRVLDPGSGTLLKLGTPDQGRSDERHLLADWTEFLLDHTVGDPPPIMYTYDFGDDWRHAVIFEGFEQAPGRRKLKPECLAGASACPPEDSGGPHAYAEFLAASADPDHPGKIDPTSFSPADVRFDDPRKRWRMTFDTDRN